MSQQINLFNPRFRKEKRYLTAPMLAMLVGAVLFGSLSLAVAARGRAAAMQQEADQVKAELQEAETRRQAAIAGLAPRARDPLVAQQLARAQQDRQALHGVAAILEQNRIGDPRGYADYFEALGRSRVAGLWLTGVQVDGGQGDIGLRGRALRAELLPGYLSGLAREPVLRGKAFGRVEIGRPAPVLVAGTSLSAAPAGAEVGVVPAAAPGTAAAPVAVTPPYVEFSLQASGQRLAEVPR